MGNNAQVTSYELKSMNGQEEKQEKTVCFCMNVSSGAITRVIQEGASSVAEISEKTCAGTACGKCLPQLGQMLKCAK
jgi:nitrite reductase (NADH) large subunit